MLNKYLRLSTCKAKIFNLESLFKKLHLKHFKTQQKLEKKNKKSQMSKKQKQ
jgi:hypothetical protein